MTGRKSILIAIALVCCARMATAQMPPAPPVLPTTTTVSTQPTALIATMPTGAGLAVLSELVKNLAQLPQAAFNESTLGELLTRGGGDNQAIIGAGAIPSFQDTLAQMASQFQSMNNALIKCGTNAPQCAESAFCGQWLTARLIQDMYLTLLVSNPVATLGFAAPIGAYLAGTVAMVPPFANKYLDSNCEKYRPPGAKTLPDFLVATFGDNAATQGLITYLKPLDDYYQAQHDKQKADGTSLSDALNKPGGILNLFAQAQSGLFTNMLGATGSTAAQSTASTTPLLARLQALRTSPLFSQATLNRKP